MTLMRWQLIKQAQSLGMSLSEIKEFFKVRDRALRFGERSSITVIYPVMKLKTNSN
jgi:DNA-binding transcriptional MerR regulator